MYNVSHTFWSIRSLYAGRAFRLLCRSVPSSNPVLMPRKISRLFSTLTRRPLSANLVVLAIRNRVPPESTSRFRFRLGCVVKSLEISAVYFFVHFALGFGGRKRSFKSNPMCWVSRSIDSYRLNQRRAHRYAIRERKCDRRYTLLFRVVNFRTQLAEGEKIKKKKTKTKFSFRVD